MFSPLLNIVIENNVFQKTKYCYLFNYIGKKLGKFSGK